LVTNDSFICPYIDLPLPSGKSCEVESCSFCLADVPLSRAYYRCFLNYVKATAYNPHKLDDLEQVEYAVLPISLREQIVRLLLDFKPEDEADAKRTFYMSLFSIMAQDTTISLAKRQHAPVLYRQCCVCGTPSDYLWFPKHIALPPGHGYCSWHCWQETPPPLLALMRILEVDFLDMTKNIPFPHGQKSKLVFTNHLTRWVLGDTPMK
jgi:hypothetical protein